MGIIGLTGGTGSGKSEAARRFADLGFAVIDADAVGHAVIEPGGQAYDAVKAAFGEAVLTEDRIDRVKLGALVFRDEALRKRLNGLIHPAIGAVIAQRCADHFAAGHRHVIVDAALLAESGVREPWLDGLILVLCPADERKRRLVESRGMDPAEADRRIAAQSPPESKRSAADWIIDNHGTIEALHDQIDHVAEAIRDEKI